MCFIEKNNQNIFCSWISDQKMYFSLNIVKYFKMSLNIVKEESSLTNIVTKPSLTKGRFQKHKNYSFL